MINGLIQHITVEESTSKQFVNNLCDFLFTFLVEEALPRGDLHFKERILSSSPLRRWRGGGGGGGGGGGQK